MALIAVASMTTATDWSCFRHTLFDRTRAGNAHVVRIVHESQATLLVGTDDTYKMANFLGRKLRTGSRVKHTTKRAMAARFSPPKTRMRSHRLTAQKGGD